MRGTKAILCLAFVASACGKDHQLADAATADANSTDAHAGVDADLHGTVTVTVLKADQSGLPAPNVPVAFIEPDGSLAKEALTGVDGKATADVLPGASVTAVYVLAPTQHDLETITGVKPGDDLTIGGSRDQTPAGTFTVNLFEVIGSSEYRVYGPCGDGVFTPLPPSGGPILVQVPLTFKKYCQQATMDPVAVRYVNGTATDYVELPGVAFTDAGSTTQITAWTALPTLAASYTNIPSDVTSLEAADFVPDALGFPNSILVNPTASANIDLVVPLAARALVQTIVGGTTHTGTQTTFHVVDGTTSTYALDIGANLLPWLGVPTLDVTTATADTASTGGGGPGDAFNLQVNFSRLDTGSGSGTGAPTDYYTWTVWAPTVANIHLPTLPTDLAANNPKAGDTVGFTTAYLLDLDLATGYDAVRAHLDSGFDAYYDGRGALGKLRASESSNQLSLTQFLHVMRGR